ncbi:MAG TPA: response regulator [Gemmataceae bacterium]|nr:response regulator [Gemmataceae bacterium]
MSIVLVVDDDADTRVNMADILTDVGYTTHTADCAEGALEKARQQPYDIGLIDLRMPGMDGLTLCGHLKRLCPNMATMIITGFPHDGLIEEASAVGVKSVVTKPINFGKLLDMVQESLSRDN